MTPTQTQPATPRLGRYAIDPTTSTVTFRTRHVLGLLPVRGSFAIRGGAVDVAQPLTDSTVHARVDAASFHTGTRARDKTVRSARFLDADTYPAITFVSERIDGDASEATVTGTLTVRGIARPVTLAVRHCAATPDALTVHATTRLDRTEFGMTASRGMTGRWFDISLEVTCLPA